jgi:hypothetical protein
MYAASSVAGHPQIQWRECTTTQGPHAVEMGQAVCRRGGWQVLGECVLATGAEGEPHHKLRTIVSQRELVGKII